MLRRRRSATSEHSLKENLLSERSKTRGDRATSSEGAAFVKLAAATLLLVLVGFAAAAGIDAFGNRRQPFLRRLPGPRVAALRQFVETEDVSWASKMLWGTYRSGSYLGLRTRSPRSLSAGLMWFDPDSSPASSVPGQQSFGDSAPTVPPLRHEAQERDRGEKGEDGSGSGLETFGWVRHDGEGYGQHRVVDLGGALELETTFLKREVRGSVGGDWAVRVSAKRGEGGVAPEKQRVSLLFYVADEGVVRDRDEGNGPLELSGRSSGVEVMPKATSSSSREDFEEEEEEERGRRRRAAAASAAFSSSVPSPVVLASGWDSHPVGPWKLSLRFSSGNKSDVDLRYVGRRRSEPGALLRGLTEYLASELEVGGDAAASEAEADRAFSASSSIGSTGLRRRRREGSGGGGAGGGGSKPRLALSKHALPNVVDPHSSALSVVLDREEQGVRGTEVNLAAFQLTAELPFEADFVFVGGGGGEAETTTTASRRPSLGRLLGRRPLLEEPLPPIPPSRNGAPSSSTFEQRVAALSGDELTRASEAAAAAFDARFDRVFGRGSKRGDDELSGLFSPGTVESVSKAAISNLLGGMAYFYGSPEVKTGTRTVTVEVGDDGERATATATEATTARGAPGPLFTATPSRAFFPRGFLWDEGFHQLALARWSRPLARDALAHWLDAVSATGWIPREQILGKEAEARVPREFVAQDPSVANPPTLLLPLSAMARGVAEAEGKLDGDDDGGRRRERLSVVDPEAAADAELLDAAYPRVKAWVEWLLETQAGGDGSGTAAATTFRWRGRERPPDDGVDAPSREKRQELNPKTLASGLDDYPRPSHPDDEEERHVDLLCWAALATRLLATVAEARGGSATDDAARFSRLASSLGSSSNLVRNHWDEENGGFFDWGYHTDDLSLEWRYVLDEETGYPVDVVLARVPRKASADGDDDGGGATAEEREQRARALAEPPRPRFVSHVGYVSLFPLLLRLIPRDGEGGGASGGGPSPSELLSSSLDHVEHLLDPRSGLASLSRDSTFHAARNTEHDAPYWRGAVWPPINYLALSALDYYAKGGKSENALRAAQLRDRLRAAFVGNVVARATEGGGVCDVWERYDDDGTQEEGRGGGRARDEEGRGRSYPGAGLGPRPFTGWGSTVALAAAGIYFDI